MCTGCGGTCQSPRFASPAGSNDLVVLGTHMAPTAIPVQLLRQQPGTLSYQTLYTGLSATGEPAVLVAPGTFGPVVPAGRR